MTSTRNMRPEAETGQTGGPEAGSKVREARTAIERLVRS